MVSGAVILTERVCSVNTKAGAAGCRDDPAGHLRHGNRTKQGQGGLLRKSMHANGRHSERSEESRSSGLFETPDPSRALRMTPICTFSTAPQAAILMFVLTLQSLHDNVIVVASGLLRSRANECLSPVFYVPKDIAVPRRRKDDEEVHK